MAVLDLPADDRALEALLRERRFGPPDPGDVTPWDFALRWPEAAVRGRVWPIVSRLLLDEDEHVRARSLELVRDWSDGADVTTPRLVDVAEHHPDRFGDQDVEGVSLRNTLAHVLSNRVDATNGPRIAAILREMATHEPIGGGAASVLGSYDPAFVSAQALRWGEAQARWFEEAARSVALLRRDAVIPFLRALQGFSQAARERILEIVDRYMKRDDATANVLAQGEGLPPPTQPAPSPDDCKRAIGLA